MYKSLTGNGSVTSAVLQERAVHTSVSRVLSFYTAMIASAILA
jgi:hypothetical protein